MVLISERLILYFDQKPFLKVYINIIFSYTGEPLEFGNTILTAIVILYDIVFNYNII